jgi:hypothetical protein
VDVAIDGTARRARTFWPIAARLESADIAGVERPTTISGVGVVCTADVPCVKGRRRVEAVTSSTGII